MDYHLLPSSLLSSSPWSWRRIPRATRVLASLVALLIAHLSLFHQAKVDGPGLPFHAEQSKPEGTEDQVRPQQTAGSLQYLSPRPTGPQKSGASAAGPPSENSSWLRCGDLRFPAESVVFSSNKTVAFAAPNPILQGHLLVCPRRAGVCSLADLDNNKEKDKDKDKDKDNNKEEEEEEDAELTDFFTTARRAQAVIERVRNAHSSNLSFNCKYSCHLTENAAGSEDRHRPLQLIMHILPRTPGDSQNWSHEDEIHQRLDSWHAGESSCTCKSPTFFPDDGQRKPRGFDEMAVESKMMRQHCGQQNIAFPTDFKFASIPIKQEQIFFLSPRNLTLALVNIKPLVPGHVLVVPCQNGRARLRELSEMEYHDLWASVQYLVPVLRSIYKTADVKIGVQDGPGSGQSVPHPHVHILPIRLQ